MLKGKYENATVYLAWEHVLLDRFAKDIVKTLGGDPGQVPPWPDRDYDTIFVIKITSDQGRKTVSFAVDHENLNHLSDECP